MDRNLPGSITQLENQPCIFPVGKWRFDENKSYGDIELFNKDDLLFRLERSASELNEKLQIAWAVVLRFYVVNRIISFATISNSQAYLCKVKTPRLRINHKPTAQIISYDIPNQARLRDVYMVSSKIWEQRDWANGQVNTAIHFIKSYCPQDAVDEQPEDPYCEALKEGYTSINGFIAVVSPLYSDEVED